jgi:hypothetical protein
MVQGYVFVSYGDFAMLWWLMVVSAPCLNGATGNAAMRLTISHHNPIGCGEMVPVSMPAIRTSARRKVLNKNSSRRRYPDLRIAGCRTCG